MTRSKKRKLPLKKRGIRALDQKDVAKVRGGIAESPSTVLTHMSRPPLDSDDCTTEA